MAWEQILYPITSYVEQGTIVNFSCCENVYVNRQGDAANIAFIANYMTGGFTDSISFPASETEIFRQGAFSITLKQSTAFGADKGFQLRCKKDGESLNLAFSTGGNDSYKGFYKFAFAIDRINQKGAFVVGTYSQSDYYSTVGRVRSDIDSYNTERNLYNWLIQAIPITYQWQSVPSISGKNGILQLSQIKSAELNGGDPVSGASGSVIERLIEQTKLSTLAQGLSEETPVVYSDDVNYMSLTPTANSTCTLKFYLDGNVIYSLTGVSLNAYLQLLKDETNEVMKPSIIYKSGVDTYLFHPDFYNDGRDTVRYDANNQINIGTSSGEIVENYTEGELYTYSGDAIVSNGEVYWGNERHDYLGWGFDAAKNQAVIDPNGTVTFAGSFKRTGTISVGYVHNTCAEIDIWCDPTYDADCPNLSRYHAILIPLSIGYVSACAEDADTEDDFLVSWSGEMNYNPNADMELNTWYEFKQVWQLSGGNVASVSYYRDGVLIGTTKNVSSNAVRFVNVTGTNRKITAITLFLGNNLHAKDVYIEYD